MVTWPRLTSREAVDSPIRRSRLPTRSRVVKISFSAKKRRDNIVMITLRRVGRGGVEDDRFVLIDLEIGIFMDNI